MVEALKGQVGGDHYKKLKIQPVEYIHANNIGFAEGSAIKYLTRWRDKGGVEDLKKAKHFIELLIDLETKAGDQKALDENDRLADAFGQLVALDLETAVYRRGENIPSRQPHPEYTEDLPLAVVGDRP